MLRKRRRNAGVGQKDASAARRTYTPPSRAHHARELIPPLGSADGRVCTEHTFNINCLRLRSTHEAHVYAHGRKVLVADNPA